MRDPTYKKDEINANPVWQLAFALSEIENDHAPLGWGKYIYTAECLLAVFDIRKKPVKMYLACCVDRHIDPCITVHRNKGDAIDACKKFMDENARFPDSITESSIKGWLYHAEYSEEGDHVYAQEVELE